MAQSLNRFSISVSIGSGRASLKETDAEAYERFREIEAAFLFAKRAAQTPPKTSLPMGRPRRLSFLRQGKIEGCPLP